MMNVYKEEEFPYNVFYVYATDSNLRILTRTLGKNYSLVSRAYVEVDTNQMTWRHTQDYEWLYRNQPPVSEIVEVLKCIRNNKLKQLL
jgi:hypothetical protein